MSSNRRPQRFIETTAADNDTYTVDEEPAVQAYNLPARSQPTSPRSDDLVQVSFTAL